MFGDEGAHVLRPLMLNQEVHWNEQGFRCLDYRACGPTGEPTVVHIDQEVDYKVAFVADNFEAFIRGLEDDSAFEQDDGEAGDDVG